MHRTILIERVFDQTRIAVVEDGQVCEVYVSRPDNRSLTGNLYLGRVENIVKGLGAAFVDIGEEKNAFLPLNEVPNGIAPKPGASVFVQVDKEPGGTKGCRLTCRINLPGRRIVCLPFEQSVAVSQKIADEEERARLLRIGRSLAASRGPGLIVRTAAEGSTEADIRADYESTVRLYREIVNRAEHGKAPALLHSEEQLTVRLARDMLNDTVTEVLADGDSLYDELSEMVQLFAPGCADRVRKHEGAIPVFDVYGVDKALDKAMTGYVWLDSGGSLVLNETEALTVIDVNTAKFTGKAIPEETIFKLNCEAAQAVARLLRLRDVGGIIIVDFIDMQSEEHKEVLLDTLRNAMNADRNPHKVLGFTQLGLVELTRKKSRKPLSKQLLHICSDCSGHGMTESFETIARRIARELWRRERNSPGTCYRVEAIAPVLKLLEAYGVAGRISIKPKTAHSNIPGAYTIETII